MILDKADQVGRPVGSRSISGTDDELERYFNEGKRELFITVGSIVDSHLRRRLAKQAKSLGFHFINVFDPSAAVSEAARLGRGNFVGKNAVVNAGAVLEDMVIINSGAVVEHDCHIGSYTHVACGSVLCGGVRVGSDCLIGANSTVIQGVEIGDGSIIGAGSLVLKDTGPGSKIYGVYR